MDKRIETNTPKKLKVCAIIVNGRGQILLQKRDEDPEKDKWVLFGGGMEEGEQPEETLKREILEELEYEIKGFRFFRRYEPDLKNAIPQIVFVVEEPVALDQLSLHEGAEMRFFLPDELKDVDFGFNFGEIIEDYLAPNIEPAN